MITELNGIHTEELHDVRETLCYGLDEESKVDKKCRDLFQLLINLGHFYLNVNKHRKDKLDWFGKWMGSFKVAFGRDGAPFGKDDQALHFSSNFFRATALYLSCTPTSWAIGYVLPIHAKQL